MLAFCYYFFFWRLVLLSSNQLDRSILLKKARECLSRFLVNELIFNFSYIFYPDKTKSQVYDKVYDKNFALNLSD
jgi:hypothetical protein